MSLGISLRCMTAVAHPHKPSGMEKSFTHCPGRYPPSWRDRRDLQENGQRIPPKCDGQDRKRLGVVCLKTE